MDEAALRQFGRGSTDGSIWFETDRTREWLTEFGPESMSDLVLLRALYYNEETKVCLIGEEEGSRENAYELGAGLAARLRAEDMGSEKKV